ncbi:Transferase [Macleaya cordata]|uniref:Transferase n=1 Tax=Macleaya cordata TaxID=56857 RepID=A0A200QU43_MACCD|nr:Transferase [Macleaya cordata]
MAIENGKDESVVERVKVINKTNVYPSKKLGRRECPLITFDLPYVTFYYNQKLLLYKGGEFEEMVGKLKEGLGVILEDFFPLAGRLGKDEEGVLRVVCDDENAVVEVVEAVAEGVGVAELAEEESSDFLHEIVPYTGVMNLEGLHRPLLAVQFTKLKDGLAIGCAFNHAILDGSSTWHFMSSWAEICRGSTTISVPPFHDRTKARNTRVKLDLPESAAAFEKKSTTSDAVINSAPQLREKIFRFSGPTIEKIKSKANENLPNDSKPFSTFQSLGTHIWCAVTRARHLKPEDYTVFTVFADCRKRVDPPMPENYFGNLIQAIFTVTAAGALLSNPTEFGTKVLQNVIGLHDSKAINDRNNAWESDPKLFQYKDAGINCVAVGSSPRFPVYEVDFGWGKPERVRSGTNNKFDGMVYLYQGKDGGKSVDIEITLEAEAMKNLERDEEFVKV